ncbi:MAG TPA: hypothetical protein VM143_15700 [Acidimicrobiales bacterium]|nr:hypothetical protein [Acidimicrobiales bacterium]
MNAVDLRRHAGAEALTLGFFTVLSAAWWWPLALHLRTRQLELVPIDSAYNEWILGWGAHALVHDPLHFFAANAYHPHVDVLSWGDNLFALVVLTVPLRPVLGLVGAYNLLLLASSTLTGWFTSLLLRELGAIRTAAVLGGVFAAFSSVRVMEHGHLQVLSTQWIPLVFLFGERTWRRGGWRNPVALGVAVTLVLATNLYLAMFTVIAFGSWTVVRLISRDLRPRPLLACTAAWAVAVAACVPLYLPSVRLQAERHVVRPLTEQQGSTLEAFDPRRPPGAPIRRLAAHLDVTIGGRVVPPDNYATPGIVLLFAAITSMVVLALRRRRVPVGSVVVYGVIAAVSGLASFGPSMRWRGRDVVASNPFFQAPYRFLPGYDALRVPSRWLLITAFSGGVVVALLASPALATIRSRAMRVGAVVTLAVVSQVELSAAPWSLGTVTRLADRPSLEWIAGQPADTVIVELPITGDVSSAVTQEIEGRRLLLSAEHLRRRVNGGISPYIPASYGDPVEVVNDLGVDPRALGYLREWKVDYVLFEPADQLRYADRMRSPEQVEIDLDALDGLERVRDFGDAIVYRVRR